MTRFSYGARLSHSISPQMPLPDPRSRRRENIPGDLLNNLPHERSSLAQVTLCPRDAGLDNTGFGFLYQGRVMLARPSSFKFEMKILQEVSWACLHLLESSSAALEGVSYVAFVETDREAGAFLLFGCHFVFGVVVVKRCLSWGS